MNTNTVTVISPFNFARIDQSQVGVETAASCFRVAAFLGRIHEPAEVIGEGDMVNEDYFSPEDFDAWEQDMEERELNALWQEYRDEMDRNYF